MKIMVILGPVLIGLILSAIISAVLYFFRRDLLVSRSIRDFNHHRHSLASLMKPILISKHAEDYEKLTKSANKVIQ